MGLFCSRLRKSVLTNRDYQIKDNYESLDEVKAALQKFGLETCQLIVGVDFTKSNTWTGKNTFRGKCLHDVKEKTNPYQAALTIIAESLEEFDSDNSIPCYGFGDKSTEDKAVFSFIENNEKPKGLEPLIARYREIAKRVDFYGPTSFAPLIRQAMVDVHNGDMRFHVLLILADGQVSTSCFRETADAIVQACYFPLAIIMVGVGDGPWDAMKRFDDDLPRRPWDNFQFVEFNRIIRNLANVEDEKTKADFAISALAEVPRQFKICETRIEATRDTSKRIINQIKSAVKVKHPPPFVFADRVSSQERNLDHITSEDYVKFMGSGHN